MPIFYKPMNITDEQYKIEQIKFVSDFSGSSYPFILCMFVASTLLQFLHHLLHVYFPVLHSNFFVYLFSDLLISVPSIMIPLFFPSTIYPLTIILTVFYLIACWKYPQEKMPDTYPKISVAFIEGRSMVNMWTIIAIFAVDFVIFPRIHTKSEFFGLSLMDFGVGAIVVLSGASSGVKDNMKTPYLKNLWDNILGSIPLYILGFIRLISTKATGYQHHLSEYGVHMNFFFVLAGIQVLTALLRTHRKYCWIVSFVMMTVYEFCLHYFDLYTYAQTADRSSSFFAANREGLLSIFGYAAIHMTCCSLYYYYTIDCSKQYRKKLDVFYCISGAILFTLYYLSSVFIAPSCRPLMNLTYFLAVISLMVAGLSVYDFIPMHLPVKPTAASNGLSLNQLPLFLIANLLTGAANFLMYTLYVPKLDALVIVFTYTCIMRTMAFCLGYFHAAFKFRTLEFVILNEDYSTPIKRYSLMSLFKSKKSSAEEKKTN